jgi:hypothetical protein
MVGSQRLAGAFFALTISALAGLALTNGPGKAATVTATAGLAPQFSRWPVPLYTSHVEKTMTWAPNSYEIDTSDSSEHVLDWFSAKLKNRAMRLHTGGFRVEPNWCRRRKLRHQCHETFHRREHQRHQELTTRAPPSDVAGVDQQAAVHADHRAGKICARA